jgi:hypothetical protein
MFDSDDLASPNREDSNTFRKHKKDSY